MKKVRITLEVPEGGYCYQHAEGTETCPYFKGGVILCTLGFEGQSVHLDGIRKAPQCRELKERGH